MKPPPLNQFQLRILARLDSILKRANPCNIHTKDGEVVCREYATRWDGSHSTCCHGCKHLSSGGCMVQSPACKFWFCGRAWEILSEKDQKQIRKLGALWRGQTYFRYDGIPWTGPNNSPLMHF